MAVPNLTLFKLAEICAPTMRMQRSHQRWCFQRLHGSRPRTVWELGAGAGNSNRWIERVRQKPSWFDRLTMRGNRSGPHPEPVEGRECSPIVVPDSRKLSGPQKTQTVKFVTTPDWPLPVRRDVSPQVMAWLDPAIQSSRMRNPIFQFREMRYEWRDTTRTASRP